MDRYLETRGLTNRAQVLQAESWWIIACPAAFGCAGDDRRRSFGFLEGKSGDSRVKEIVAALAERFETEAVEGASGTSVRIFLASAVDPIGRDFCGRHVLHLWGN